MMNSVASVHRKYSIRNTLVEPQQCCSICPHRNSGSAQYNHCSYYSCVWVCNSCAACWLQSENNISISCVGARKWKNFLCRHAVRNQGRAFNLCNLCERVTHRLLKRSELLLGSLDLLLKFPALLLQSQKLLSGLDQLLLILTYPLFLLLVLWLQRWDLKGK